LKPEIEELGGEATSGGSAARCRGAARRVLTFPFLGVLLLFSESVGRELSGGSLTVVVAAGEAPAAGPDFSAHYSTGVRTRDGIGKYYFGREIAHYMTHQGAPWLERPEREDEERPDLVLRALRLQPGEVVADLGCGTGYFTWRMAGAVGAQGTVYGIEIQPEMLALLDRNMKARGVNNVVPVLGTVTDPQLPQPVDLVLMVDVYHEFSHPAEMMAAICRNLKPGGRVVLIEYRGEDPSVPIKPLHKMTAAQVRKEMSLHPLEHVETVRSLPRQHLIVFRKTAGTDAAPAGRRGPATTP